MKFINIRVICLATFVACSYSSIVFSGTTDFTKSGPESEMNYTGGNVGIGTDNPAHLLEVFGNKKGVTIRSAAGGTQFRMIDDATSADWKFKVKEDGGFKIRDQSNGIDAIQAEPQVSATSSAIHIDANGNVGIGATTENVASTLSVNGKIEAKEIEIKLTSASWPDYVFQKDYSLPSLKEIEVFTKKHKHLPGVPSEKNIVDEGLSLGEMATIQMKKIEELTLYLIALEKKNIELSQRIEKLEEHNM